MIRGAKLRNWRSHSESEFLFEGGTNVLVGISGSGKSSVMDAISFGLFGTFPALNGRKVKLDDLVRDGQKKAEIVVDFLEGYSVRRVVERGKGTTTSELRKAGKLVEGIKTGPVTKKVEGILKIDYELFERAVYSEQNQIDYFLRIPRGKRKDKIDQLLGIDQFETARKSSVKLVNELAGSAKEYERILREFEGVGAKEKKDIEKRLEKIEEAAKKGKKEFEEVEKEKSEASEELKEWGVRSDNFIRIRTTLSGLGERKRGLEKIAKEKPELGKAEVEKRISGIEKEVQKRNKLLGIYESGLDEGKKKVRERVELAEKLEGFGERDVLKEFEELERGLKKREGELTKLKTRREFLERSVSEVDGDKCPVCGREWSEHMRGEVKAEREAELEKVKLVVGGAETEISELNVQVEALGKEAEVFGKCGEALKGLGEPEKDVEKFEKLVDEFRAKGREDSETLQELRRDLEILKAAEELDGIGKEISEKEAELGKLGFDEKKFEELKKGFNSILERWNDANGELVSLWTSRDTLTGELRRIEGQEKEVKILGEKLEKMRAGEEFLVKFKNALLGVQEELRTEFVKSLNDAMSELWESLYPYGDFTDVRLGVEGGDYVLQLKRGGWVDVEGIVSGGERSTAALVLRVGFALALAPHLRVLILDEPTHNLDDRGITELGNVLRKRIQDYVSQVFLITHEERLEQAVSGSLYRLERDKGRGAATQVTLVEAS